MSGMTLRNGFTPETVLKAQVATMGRFIQNLTTVGRSRALSGLLEPNANRDFDKEFGYPRPESMTAAMFRQLYDREGIATRIVNVFPDECWSVYPELYERESSRRTTFEIAWDDLLDRLDVWHYLHRADRLSGIGRYGVLLLGFDDGDSLERPVPGWQPDGTRDPRAPDLKLLYLRAFDESLVQINALEGGNNPRYGQPTSYNISLLQAEQQSGYALSFTSDPSTLVRQQQVHCSRIVHLADDCVSSDVWGTPRLFNVYPRVYDLRKILGGSAEMFWRGAFPGLSIETFPELAAEGVELDADDAKEQLERYMNGLQRYLTWTGAKTNVLAPAIQAPTHHVKEQYQYIATAKEIPLRVLVGSEAGQLASTQDANTMNRRTSRRQKNYLNPRVIRRFVDRMVLVGALPPTKSYNIVWTDLNSLTDEQQAAVAMKKTQSLLQYVTSGAETVMPVLYFFVDVLGLSEERAQMILDEVRAGNTDQLTRELWEAPPEAAMANTTGTSGTGSSRNAQKSARPKSKAAAKKSTTSRNT